MEKKILQHIALAGFAFILNTATTSQEVHAAVTPAVAVCLDKCEAEVRVCRNNMRNNMYTCLKNRNACDSQCKK